MSSLRERQKEKISIRRVRKKYVNSRHAHLLKVLDVLSDFFILGPSL